MGITPKMDQVFKDTYNRYADAIFRHCYFKTSDREQALDLMQQTYLQAWSYLVSGQEIKDWRPFLYRLANNLIIDWYRRKKSESLDNLIEEGFEPVAKESGPDQLAEFNLAIKLLNHLDEADQQLIIWRYVEDYSPPEMAKMLDDSTNNVSVRLSRALAKLKKILAEQTKNLWPTILNN